MNDATATEGFVSQTQDEEAIVDEFNESLETEDEDDSGQDDTEDSDAEEVGEDDSEDQDADETEEDEDDSEEEDKEWSINYGGNELKIPKDQMTAEQAQKLEDFSKNIWSDYTQKSQRVAELNKTLAAREESVLKLQNLTDEMQNTYARGLHIKEELKQLNEMDLQALWNSPHQEHRDEARKLTDLKSQKQAELNKIVQIVDQQDNAIHQTQNEETKRRYLEGVSIMDNRIKGFSNEKAQKVIEYAVSKGVPKEQAETWPLNLVSAEAMYKAMLYDEMQKTVKKSTKNKNKNASEPIKPLANKKIKGKGARANKNPSNMSPEEYQTWWAKKQNK